MFAEAEFVGDFAVAEPVSDQGDYLLFARSQELHAQGVDHPEGRHLRDHFNQILQLLTIRPHLAMVHALYALAEQAERILGKSEQPFGAGAEGVGHEVSVVGTQQENLCHLGVRQMQSAKHGHVRPAVLWMYGRDRQVTTDWLRRKFADRPELAQANVAALNAGHAFGETAEMSEHLVGYTVPRAPVEPGRYRAVSGTEAIAWGLIAGMRGAGIQRMIFAGYPITPASLLLHTLANLKSHGVITFQAEDEIAAIGAAIGAAYAGALGVTSSSGPGVALKTEMLGLAIATELPIVLVDSQRAGPSTGMPTKAEQSDLFQAVHGRNADAPLAVLAAATASDCFEVAIEAVRIATKYMTPVILLSDAYLAHAAEPWRLPDPAALPRFPVHFRTDPAGFHPFQRDPVTLARAWAVPGTPELEHRIGGLEKDYETGHISYDPENHARMTRTRAAKIAGIANGIPLQTVALGADHGAIAVVGWGSTYGAIHQAVRRARQGGIDASHVHLRYLNPFPRNLGELLRRFHRIVVPELNNGQLVQLLRAAYLVPAEGLNKVQGKPFKVSEISEAIEATLGRARDVV